MGDLTGYIQKHPAGTAGICRDMAVGQGLIKAKIRRASADQEELHVIRCPVEQHAHDNAVQIRSQTGPFDARRQDGGGIGQFRKDTAVADGHAGRGRQPSGFHILRAGQKISQPDRVQGPGDIHVDIFAVFIEDDISPVEDAAVVIRQPQDLAAAGLAFGRDGKAGQGRTLHREFNAAADVPFIPKVKKLLFIGLQFPAVPFCMVSERISDIG